MLRGMNASSTAHSGEPRVWLITGASTGFGRALAEAVLARGDRLVATARNPDTIADLAEHPSAACLALDVTDGAQVSAAVGEAVRRMGHLDVLVNNAGHGMVGAIEELSDAEIHQVLATNLHGALAMTRAVLPHMRARRRGHIVALSSVGGVRANPGHGIYACSKFALEGFSEALAAELAPFGIRVTIVQPGPFRTDFAGRSLTYATPIDDYRDTPAGSFRDLLAGQHGTQPGDPVRAAEVIMQVVEGPPMPLRLPMGHAAVTRIRAKLEQQLADLEACAELSLSTDFPTR